jgi:hypothetical protein
MHIFKCFENQSDTYHDTRSHYLMEKDLMLLQDQADGMDATSPERMEVLKKKDGPSRAKFKSIWLLVLHV